MLRRHVKYRRPVNLVHSIIKTQTAISPLTNNDKEDVIFKTLLKDHLSPDIYNDLETHWKSIGID
jgi:hypothetical protein